ncbi:hypothetical protein LTR97_012184 [Elasticomyces elasticus]|uniref:Uncharacterized protein n=1 Tax=Elasticomyces elasticus TaxID=574655 RepID=A0AAN7VM74_9PEZI|nr:hypothetical protein LTR97_012184 [Elasticomyces elasticus]
MLDPVERIYNILHLLRDGCIRDGGGVLPEDRDWFAIPLSPAQFEAFEDKLEATGEYSAEENGYAGVKGFYGDKVRWDYDPTFRGGEYVIRQRSTRHGIFCSELTKMLESGLRRVVDAVLDDSDEETAAAIQPLKDMWFRTIAKTQLLLRSTAKEELLIGKTKAMYRSPEILSTCWDKDVSTFVVEISYAYQDRKALKRLADSWLRSRSHHVQCVVGIQINGNEGATVSVWRKSRETKNGRDSWSFRCDVDAVPFRSIHGETCDGQLELSIADFAPNAIHAQLLKLPFADLSMYQLTVSFADLADLLTNAEAKVERWKAEDETWKAEDEAEALNNPARDDDAIMGPPNDNDDDSEHEESDEDEQAKLSRELRDAEENLKLDAYFELEKLEVEREAEEKRQK